VLLLETIASVCPRARSIGSMVKTGMRQPRAGFEIDQAMAALPAHASLPDGRRPVRIMRPFLFFAVPARLAPDRS
jgi:hypothetical protein